MELAQRLQTCKKCEKRKFDPNTGIICSLTSRKPEFVSNCNEFVVDPKEASKAAAKAYVPQEQESSGSSYGIWGVIGLILLIIRIVVRFAQD